jgi:hypothetical protein
MKTHEEQLAELNAASASLAKERADVDAAINLRVAIALAERVRDEGKLPGNAPQCLGALVALLGEVERLRGETAGAVRGLYIVRDPQGYLNHTTVAGTELEAVGLWMEQEQTLIPVFRGGKPAQSWEVYEAEGFSVIQCDLIPKLLPCCPPTGFEAKPLGPKQGD